MLRVGSSEGLLQVWCGAARSGRGGGSSTARGQAEEPHRPTASRRRGEGRLAFPDLQGDFGILRGRVTRRGSEVRTRKVQRTVVKTMAIT